MLPKHPRVHDSAGTDATCHVTALTWCRPVRLLKQAALRTQISVAGWRYWSSSVSQRTAQRVYSEYDARVASAYGARRTTWIR